MSVSTVEAPNLWGNLSTRPIVKPPRYFLDQQADVLRQMTNGLLVGQVSVAKHVPQRNQFHVTLLILVPALDNYVYEVLTVVHDLSFYPACIGYDNGGDFEQIECQNEEEFKQGVQRVLQSASVRKVVNGLLAMITPEV